MNLTVLKSKIHRANVTEANLDYEGSITIDKGLMEAASLIPHEQVHIFNLTNGERFVTYVIEGARDTGVICTNGAAAHCARKGDCLIIVSFMSAPQEEALRYVPKFVYVNAKNEQVDAEVINGKLVRLLG
ncbi:MAG: aspartate 1-decarboxylase [Thermodesulfobacteriota bacterium]|jgi:aspartate 1-decarboxylase|nr:aspartate 1-decarboxylase [Thermodesulfobacteriota bacterium]